MADRMILIPPRITARQKTTIPRLDYLFVYPDIFIGAEVRLIVYDIGIYKQGLGNREGANLAKFKKSDDDRAVLSQKEDPRLGSELDPLLVNGSGVLLKVDGILLRSPKMAVPRGWWFEKTAGPTDNSDKPFSTVELRLPTTEQDAIAGRVNSKPIGKIIIRDDTFQNQFTDHRLAFRVVLTDAYAGLVKGTVIASSLCPQHNPACVPTPPGNPDNTGAIIFEDAAVKKGKPPRIGGDEDTSEPTEPAIESRIMPFDLTGHYEHDNRPNDPELVFQLSQAGRGLVGWFSRAPSIAGPKKPVAGVPQRGGCLWISSMLVDDPSGKGYQFLWGMQDAAKSGESIGSDGVCRTDADTLDATGKLQQMGWLKRIPVPNPDGTLFDERLEITFEHDDGSDPATITLQKVRNGARWPWAILRNSRFLSREQRETLIAAQVQPMPTSAWDRLRKGLDPDQVIEKHPKERKLFEVVLEWSEASDGAARDGARAVISTLLENLLSPYKGFNAAHLSDAVERLHKFAAQYFVLSQGKFETLYYWFQKMASQQLDSLAAKEENKLKTPEELFQRLEVGFREAKILPSGRYIYTMSFQNKGASVKFVKAYAFQMTIDKQIRNDDGTFGSDAFWSKNTTYFGYFIGGGAGLGFSFGSEGVTKPKPKGKATEIRSGGMPSKAVFESFSNLANADFNDSSFSIGAFSALSVTAPGIHGAATAGSMMEFHLKSGVDLIAIVSEDFQHGFGDATVSAGATIVDISMGYGNITTDDVPSDHPPVDSSDSIVKPTSEEMLAWAPVLFAKDSATLLDRTYFERRLALNRAAFEVAQPRARCLGYTSPEGSRDYNQSLSVRRAAATKAAVTEAFMPEMVPSAFDVVGFGEDPSIKKGGLHDPPGKSDAERAVIHAEEAQYPQWRAVDCFVASMLVVRAAAKDEQKGKNP